MALPTNFKDDILNASMGGKRRYKQIANADGTISLEDVTRYDQLGSDFGAGQINSTNKAVNDSFSAKDLLKTKEEVAAVTVAGKGVDALVVKELNESLSGIGNIIYGVYSSLINVGGSAEITNIVLPKGTWIVGLSSTNNMGQSGLVSALIDGKVIRFDGCGVYPFKTNIETTIKFMNTSTGARTFSNVEAYAIKVK